MPRKKNDGKGRIGGRAKGTPNKLTSDLKGWIAEILEGGKERFATHLNTLEPQEYIRVYTSLVAYVVAKPQPISEEERLKIEYREMERLIDIAPDEFIDRISERILKVREDGEGFQERRD